MPFSSSRSSSSSSYSSHSYSSSSSSSRSFSSYKSTTTTVQSKPPAVGTTTLQSRGLQNGPVFRTSYPMTPGVTVIHSGLVVQQPVIVQHSWGCSMFHPLSPCSAWAPWSIWHTQPTQVVAVGQPGYVPQQYNSGPGFGTGLVIVLVAAVIGTTLWALFRRR